MTRVGPRAILTGLHSHDQCRIISSHNWCTIGLVEMALPSDRHSVDKRRSKALLNYKRAKNLLLPGRLVGLVEPGAKNLIDYGCPEPENDWIAKGGNGCWALRSSPWTTRGSALSGRVCFLGQHHSGNRHVLKQVANSLAAAPLNQESNPHPLAFLPHPSDNSSTELPGNCALVRRRELKLQAIAEAPLVITEYSNLGYSLALAGKRVLYVYQDPQAAMRRMGHLAVLLGRDGTLPVDHCSPEGVARVLERVRTEEAPISRVSGLELTALEEALDEGFQLLRVNQRDQSPRFETLPWVDQ